jgi:hypothetical protein
MTILASGTGLDGSDVVAHSIYYLLQTVASVDDATLGASLATALNATLVVTSTAVRDLSRSKRCRLSCQICRVGVPRRDVSFILGAEVHN